jgi:hypothetical protein
LVAVGDGFDSWKKGGVRQATLEAVVPTYLSPKEVVGFFVATRRPRSFPRSSFNPLAMLRREFVLAVAGDNLSVLSLKRPAIFRASIANVETEVPLATADIDWDGKRLRVNDKSYFPIPFHGEEAAQLAARWQPARSGAPST